MSFKFMNLIDQYLNVLDWKKLNHLEAMNILQDNGIVSDELVGFELDKDDKPILDKPIYPPDIDLEKAINFIQKKVKKNL